MSEDDGSTPSKACFGKIYSDFILLTNKFEKNISRDNISQFRNVERYRFLDFCLHIILINATTNEFTPVNDVFKLYHRIRTITVFEQLFWDPVCSNYTPVSSQLRLRKPL